MDDRKHQVKMKQNQHKKNRHHKFKPQHAFVQQFRHWFVPQKQNNFRPRMIGRQSLGFLLLAFTVVHLIAPASSAVLSREVAINPVDLLSLTNDERQEAGVGSLQINTQLTKAASLKAKDMFDHNYWSHTSPDGVTPWYWFDEADYSYIYAGENLARNFSSSNGVISAWMASPGHRENMLKDYYTEVGFAMMDGKIDGQPTNIIVAMYGTPTSSLTEVAGLQTNAPSVEQIGFFAGIGVAVQDMEPSMIGVLAVAVVALFVALISLFLAARRTQSTHEAKKLHRGHEAAKVVGISVLIAVMIIMQSSGQIS